MKTPSHCCLPRAAATGHGVCGLGAVALGLTLVVSSSAAGAGTSNDVGARTTSTAPALELGPPKQLCLRRWRRLSSPPTTRCRVPRFNWGRHLFYDKAVVGQWHTGLCQLPFPAPGFPPTGVRCPQAPPATPCHAAPGAGQCGLPGHPDLGQPTADHPGAADGNAVVRRAPGRDGHHQRQPGPGAWAASPRMPRASAIRRCSPQPFRSHRNDRRISMMNIVKAISAFERTLLSADSKYDRALKGKATPECLGKPRDEAL